MVGFPISLLCSAIVICGAFAADPAPVASPTAPPTPVEAAVPAAAERPVAIVNGEAITRANYLDALEKQYGAVVLDQLVNTALLRQEAQRCGAAQDDKLPAQIQQRVQQEVDLALLRRAREQGFGSVEAFERRYESASGGKESFAELRNRLAQEAAFYAEPQLLAEKILRQRISVTDEQVAAEFADRYGPKVIVRQIVVGTYADAETAINKLKGGADFSMVALEMSVDPVSGTRGGLVEPLPNRGVLGAAAFALKEDETSGIIRTEDGYHVLKMVRAIPARNVKLEDVKDELREQIVQTEIEKRIPELLAELRAKSKIEATGL